MADKDPTAVFMSGLGYGSSKRALASLVESIAPNYEHLAFMRLCARQTSRTFKMALLLNTRTR